MITSSMSYEFSSNSIKKFLQLVTERKKKHLKKIISKVKSYQSFKLILGRF